VLESKDPVALSKQLTALEIASAEILGTVALTFPSGPVLSPVLALQRVLIDALQREPCVVTFSGGRDSSLMLALTARLARREGLPEPIALTARFPHSELSAESDWQQLVIDHVGVKRWEIVQPGDEIELLGDVALDIHRRHGVLYPPNAHFFIPLLPYARGGTLVTGQAGDDLLLGWQARRVADVLAARRSPHRGDARALARVMLPRAIRRPIAARRASRRIPASMPDWLRAEIASQLAYAQACERVDQPRPWDAWVRWRAGWRGRALSRENEAMLAHEADVEMVHPFQDPGVVESLARAGGRLGFGDRTATMRALFGEVLPDEILARSTKAYFDEVAWGPRSREFASEWDGDTGDPSINDLIDAEALRRNWAQDSPDFRSAILLQAASLARDRSTRTQ
jgi:asparagine synthetase B (glutamine-hydrolysing)